MRALRGVYIEGRSNRMKVYLCGPINGCTDGECRDWREYVKTYLKDTLDPMRRDYRGVENEKFVEIVEGDKVDIRRCDVLLVNYIKPSVGTSMEILWAWLLEIPVIVVCPEEVSISPWMRYHSDKFFHSFSGACTYINENL